jgi:hypothetical protein
MFLKHLSVAVLAAGLMSAAQAVEVPVKKGAKAAAEAAPDDVICTYEHSVGSHLKRRTCATRAQRNERARQDQDSVKRVGKGNTRRAAEPSL